MKCPHPLCEIEFGYQSSFIYHLVNVHSLTLNEKQQSQLISGSYDGTPMVKCHKRRAHDTAEGELRPSKQPKGSPNISDQSTCQLLEGINPTMTPIVSSHTLQDIFLPSLINVVDPSDIPELAHSRATLSRRSYKPMNDDALFFQYLRSRSPSCLSTTDESDKRNNVNIEEGIHLAPGGNELAIEMSPLPAQLPKDSAMQLSKCSTSTPKSGVRLRLRQPKPQPKIALRLSRPKKSAARKSARHGHKQ